MVIVLFTFLSWYHKISKNFCKRIFSLKNVVMELCKHSYPLLFHSVIFLKCLVQLTQTRSIQNIIGSHFSKLTKCMIFPDLWRFCGFCTFGIQFRKHGGLSVFFEKLSKNHKNCSNFQKFFRFFLPFGKTTKFARF